MIVHIHTLTRGTVGCGSLFLFALFDTVFNRFFPMQGWTEAGQLPVEAPRSESTSEILLVSLSARLRPFRRHIASRFADMNASLARSLIYRRAQVGVIMRVHVCSTVTHSLTYQRTRSA